MDDAWFERIAPVPPHPDEFRIAVNGDRLGAVRLCKHCGQRTRQLWLMERIQTIQDVDGPHPPSWVHTRWPAFWWSDRRGGRNRLGTRHDPDHQARGDQLYVLHPCEIREHRPAQSTAPPPTRKAPPHMTAPQFGTPKPPGENVEKDALKGRLLLITVTEIVRDMPTKYGPADAVRSNIVCLDTGEEHSDALLFGKMLAQQLPAGTTYLGTLTHQDGKQANGNDWPWLFEGRETDPAAVATATQYYAYKATQGIAAPAAAAPVPAPVAPPAASFPPAAAQAGTPAPPWAA